MAPVEITGGEPHVVGGHGLSRLLDRRRAPHHAARAVGRGRRRGRLAQEVRVGRVGRGRDRGARHDRAGARARPRRARRRRRSQRERDARARAAARAAAACRRASSRSACRRSWTSTPAASARSYGYSEGELRIARLHLDAPRAGARGAARATTPFELMQCHDVIDRVDGRAHAGRAHAAPPRDALALLPGAARLPGARRRALDGVREQRARRGRHASR